MDKAEVIRKITEELGCDKEEVLQMSNEDMFEAYLNSEAIYGYYGEILEVVEAIYGVKLINNN